MIPAYDWRWSTRLDNIQLVLGLLTVTTEIDIGIVTGSLCDYILPLCQSASVRHAIVLVDSVSAWRIYVDG
jgi:hypothetical protein